MAKKMEKQSVLTESPSLGSTTRCSHCMCILLAIAAFAVCPGWNSEQEVGPSLMKLGTSLGLLGDINGDGFDDYLAGAPGKIGLRGQVHGAAAVIDGRTFQIIRVIRGIEPGVGFGEVVFGLPGLETGDRTFALVGFPSCNSGKGRVEVYDAGTGDLVATVNGVDKSIGFGCAIAAVDGESGTRDLFISASSESETEGAVGSVTCVALDGKEMNRRWSLESPESTPSFGISVHSLVFGSKLSGALLVVGDPGGESSEQENRSCGDVFLVRALDGVVLQSASGMQLGERFGASLEVIPDFDGDDMQDLAVGCPGFDGIMKNEGRVAILSSKDLHLIQSIPLGVNPPTEGFPSVEGACFGAEMCSIRVDDLHWLAISAPGGRWNGGNLGWVGILRRIDSGSGKLLYRRSSMIGWGGETGFTYSGTGRALLPAGAPYDQECGGLIIGAPDEIHAGGVCLYSSKTDSQVKTKWLAP